ncbi:MAG TPA: 2-phosphosulfolactate phosphatase [bacterium]|nr:2-phosphosulfolactate phosphatase [bacterium]
MFISVSLSPGNRAQDLAQFQDTLGCYVVIDVLRASTVICTALANGAREVVPFASVEAARAARRTDALLCGERDGVKLPGFDCGNSPSEYTAEAIGGRTLLYASTNGAVALANAPEKAETLVAGFVNLTAAAEAIDRIGLTTLIVCAGKEGRFALEDAVCAGALIAKLWEVSEHAEPATDSAYAAQALWDRYKDDPNMALWQSEHGQFLMSLGFGADLAACAAIDTTSVVPVKRHGALVAA